MANTLANSTWVCKEIAFEYLNEIEFVKNLSRDYDDQYVQNGAKVGDTVKARIPQRFVATDGQAMQIQNLYDQTVDISLTNQKNVAFSWSSAQATVNLDSVRERYVMPGAKTLANASDVLAYNAVYRDIYNAVGTPGTTPTALLTYLQAGVKLTNNSVALKDRVAVLDQLAAATLSNTTATLFNPSATVSANYKDGRPNGSQLGFPTWLVDPNRPVHTTGTFTACTPTVNGANQTGSTLNTQAWASGATTLKKGDIITLAGVNGVNPISYVDTGQLQQFVVTADTSDSGGNIAALPISPPIITSGALQTVTASPASGAAITVWSANPAGGALTTTTSPQSIVFTSDFAAFVMADLKKPTAGCEVTTVRNREFGISIRMVEQYQIGTDQNPSRLDILIGAATINGGRACRVVG